MSLVELKSNLSTAFKTAPVDFIDDTSSGAKGFTEKFTNPNDSKFKGIQGSTYTYPNTVIGGRLMKPNKSTNSFPGPQNFFDNNKSGAQGFTLFNSIGNSKYLGIEDGVYNYPTTVLGGRLMRPNNVASFPGPQDFFDNVTSGAQGFTLNFTNPNDSKFIGILDSQYSYPTRVNGGRLMKPNKAGSFPGPQNFFNNSTSGAQGFTLFNSIGNSKYLGISGQSYTYPNTVNGNRLMRPKDSATFPGPQNFFDNSTSGAQGFTLNFNNANESKFLGISGNQYTYPSAVKGGRLMKPNGASAYPGPQDFFNNDKSGAKGFTLNFTNPNESKFIGIQRSSLYTYPNTVIGGRLMKPNKSVAFPGPQNYFDDDRFGSVGFTLKFNTVNQTKFLGIEGRQYTYPKTVLPIHRNSVREVPLGNSKFNQGTATLENQLGNGSRFPFIKDKAYTNKIFSDSGYSEQKRYSDNIKSIKGDPEKSLLYKKSTEQNSPSAIEEQYKKFNLREEAYNFQYIDHPLILRGIQRKGKEEPNRWGFDSLVNFDDGLIQGGISASIERTANDVARIAKWMASPKGLLWIVKQVGLGFTNPKVEVNPLAGKKVETVSSFPGSRTFTLVENDPSIRQTRIHSGITSLLSVAGNPFGLHFTTHGLPWVNKLADYGEVQKQKIINYKVLQEEGRLQNRLLKLQREYKAGIHHEESNSEGLIPAGLLVGLPSPTLSDGLGGPQSVYGIGPTLIRRTLSTEANSQLNITEKDRLTPYRRGGPYAWIRSGFGTSLDKWSDSGRASWTKSEEGDYIRDFSLQTLSKIFFNVNQNKRFLNNFTPFARDYFNNIYFPLVNFPNHATEDTPIDSTTKNLILAKNYSTKLAAGGLRAKTKHDYDPNRDESEVKVDNTNWDETTRTGTFNKDGSLANKGQSDGIEFPSLVQRLKNDDNKNLKYPSNKKIYAYGALRANTRNSFDESLDTSDPKVNLQNADSIVREIQPNPDVEADRYQPLARLLTKFKYEEEESSPGATVNNIEVDLSTNESRDKAYTQNDELGASINEYATLAYNLIPKNKQERTNFTKDFRSELDSRYNHFTGKQEADYYEDYNLETKYGFGKQGSSRNRSTQTQRGANSFLFSTDPGAGTRQFKIGSKDSGRFAIADHLDFRGDRINAIDVNSRTTPIKVKSNSSDELYPDGVRDFVRLIFEDPDSGPAVAGADTRNTVMVFRGTITGLTDSFSPGWNAISVMGRPDSAYLYSSFERNLSFTFTVAATSRNEMLPIWRKLNYLAGYTMPDFNAGGTKPSGPMMRMTLGDLFDRTPGFLNSLSYTIPDDATWDIADDTDGDSYMAKQLPTVVEVSVDFKVIGDYRPQQHGVNYSLTSWLTDAEEARKGFSDAIEKEKKKIEKSKAKTDEYVKGIKDPDDLDD